MSRAMNLVGSLKIVSWTAENFCKENLYLVELISYYVFLAYIL
jgi:hypothetical protein